MYKQIKTAICQMQQNIQDLVKKYDAKIRIFQYDKKAFGNMVVEIEKCQYIFTFILDRGDIICNCKNFSDGITKTIRFIGHSTYQKSAPDYFLQNIEEILKEFEEQFKNSITYTNDAK